VTAWKRVELRVSRALGGERRGQTRRCERDCASVPWSVNVERSRRGTLERRWIDEAIGLGLRERLPWLLVVARHDDRAPVIVLLFGAFLELARTAAPIAEAHDFEEEAVET
jgi:hypothetical protein